MLNIPTLNSPLFERDQGPTFGPRIKPFALPIGSNSQGNSIQGNAVQGKEQHFELFNSLLQKSYQRLADKMSRPFGAQANSLPEYARPFEPTEKITSQRAAGNILKFMEGRLKADLANGASQSELLNRLEQGREGFIKGFNEAKQTIESLGLLTPQLESEIADTYQRVMQGLDNFKGRIEDHFAEQGLPTEQIQPVGGPTLGRVELAGSQSASFSLELITQDGDKVTIEIEKSNQFVGEAAFTQDGDNASLNINQQSSSSSRYSLNVQGEIDEAELASINQLLADVDLIANDFYQGRLDQAFASALELDIDREQLSSLNLEMQKTSVYKAMASYASNTAQPVSSPLADLNQLINKLDSAFNQIAELPSPLNVFEQVVQGIGQLQDLEYSVDKNEQLSDLLLGLIDQFEILPVERPALD